MKNGVSREKASNLAKLLFFTLGIINEIGAYLILAAAENLAENYHRTNLQPLFPMVTLGAGLFMVIINSQYLVDCKPYYRIILNSVLMTIGYILATIGSQMNIYVFLTASIFIGISCAFGEVAILGYMGGGSANKYITYFAGGTGTAGVGGVLIYFLTHSVFGLSDTYIFGLMIPSGILYLGCFLLVYKRTELQTLSYGVLAEGGLQELHNITENITNNSNTKTKMESVEKQGEFEKEEESKNQSRGMSLRIGMRYILIFFVVYYCDFGNSTGFSDRIGSKIHNRNNNNFLQKNYYIISQMCTQLGILTGRNSLLLFKLRRTYIFMLTNLLIFTLMLYITIYLWNISPLFMYALVFLSGVMNGWTYLYSIARVMDDLDIYAHNKEYVINYLMIAGDLGAAFSMASFLLFDITFLNTS